MARACCGRWLPIPAHVAEIKTEIVEIKMVVVENRKVLEEVKAGFDEMKHAIMTFFTSHTNSTFPQSYGEFSDQHSHSVCKLYMHQNTLLI